MMIARGVTHEVCAAAMLAAVDLNDQPMMKTDEIKDKSIARRLAAKVEAPRFPRAEMNP